MQRAKKLEDPAIAKSGEHVPVAVHREDDMKAPSPQPRPKTERSSASLDRIPTQKSPEKRPGTSRSNTSVNIPDRSRGDEKKEQNQKADTSKNVRPAPTPTQSQADVSLPRVLVVDDNPINLKLLQTMMRKAKHPYESATDGQQAVDAYMRSVQSKRKFKYILMDISMPIMDGVQATKEIRKRERDEHIAPPVQIIAITGMGDESSAKVEAKETGFDRFLSKPVKFQDLGSLLV